MALLSTKAKRSIIPKLEDDQTPENSKEFQEEVRQLLEDDVETKQMGEHDLQYEFEQETDNGAEYELVNEEELDLPDLPGLDTVEHDYTVQTDSHRGIETIGVSNDGTVTLENVAGNEETYFLAGAADGEAIIKDDNNLIWRYDSQEDKLEYNNANEGEWVESTSSKHKDKFDKIIDFQQQLWAVNRAINFSKEWNYSSKDESRRSSAKQTFDHVMQRVLLEGDHEIGDNEYVKGNSRRGRDIGNHFKKAQERFRAYGLMEYGIDPVDEVEVSNDGLKITYKPRKF